MEDGGFTPEELFDLRMRIGWNWRLFGVSFLGFAIGFLAFSLSHRFNFPLFISLSVGLLVADIFAFRKGSKMIDFAVKDYTSTKLQQ